MIRLVVHEDAYEIGIRNPIACLIRKISVQPTGSLLNSEVSDLMAHLREPAAILEAPEAHGFEELFGRLGHHGTVPAGRRLVESLAKRGLTSHNNVVDACNIASALAGSGLGLHDAEHVLTDIHVRRACGDERIRPLFTTTIETTRAGDLIYGTADRVMAWLGKRDVDADDFKVTEDSRFLLLMVLGNERTSSEYNRDVCLNVVRLIRKTSPTVYAQFIPTLLPPAAAPVTIGREHGPLEMPQ
jgi:DNA/RNA-binding domain of Phe-tRNA-synthetase-like protein